MLFATMVAHAQVPATDSVQAPAIDSLSAVVPSADTVTAITIDTPVVDSIVVDSTAIDSTMADSTVADSSANMVKGETESTTDFVYPRSFFGVRAGMNFADMHYTHQPIINAYDHYLQGNLMLGLFGHFQLGNSNFSVRPELSYVGRGDSLQWEDVHYCMSVNYVDARIPLTYNFRKQGSRVSPYIMLAPQFNFAINGKINYYADDISAYYVDPSAKVISTDIAKTTIRPFDFSLMVGLGLDWLINTGGMPLLFSVEGGYNFGLVDNFAKAERYDNDSRVASNHANIKNNFIDAEYNDGSRFNRGLEVAVRLAIPLDNSWRKEKKVLTKIIEIERIDTITKTDTFYIRPDTVVVHQVDTHRIEEKGYKVKDCYSFGEMYSFLTLGIDISDKRLCLFNVNFDFDSYKLRPESEKPLSDVALLLKSFPEMEIEIYGHTDSIGSEEYNQKLSENRAAEVRRWLIKQGIEPERMKSAGFGKKFPIESNSTEEGRFHNRLVEIEVMNIGEQKQNLKITK